jgi:hypothetical protein
MHRLLAGVALACALSGTARSADAPDFKATAHTVAIISLLGETLQNPSGELITSPGAGFDDIGEHAMAAQIIADLPGVTVVRVGGPRDVLLLQMYPRNGFGDVGMENVRATLKDWAAAHSADYIVILRKVVGPGGGYRSAAYGIGLNYYGAFAFLNVTVCDGHTLKPVAQFTAQDLKWGSIAYGDGRNALTPEKLSVLTDDTRAMLASLVPGLVHGVGL